MTSGRFGLVAAGACLLLVPACSPATSGVQGISCNSDSDCNSGLKCLDFELPQDSGPHAGCSSLGKTCLMPCATNADCKKAGPGLTCYAACSATLACVPASSIVAHGDAATDAVSDGPVGGER